MSISEFVARLAYESAFKPTRAPHVPLEFIACIYCQQETTVNYLCLVYLAQDKLNACPDNVCHAYGEELRASGHHVASQALQPIDTATTVRIRNGQMTLTDGPFAETKEQLAGFYMIEAKDLNEAIHWASKIPPARFGSIEVRPVRQLDIADVTSNAKET